jgi:hypothetical protein
LLTGLLHHGLRLSGLHLSGSQTDLA